MKPKVLAAIYIALWIGVAAFLGYLGAAAGHSPWLIGGGAFIAFFLVNGSLAYYLRSRQLRREGKQAPSYSRYLFQTDRLQATRLSDPVEIPALIRIALGLLVIFGGALFIFGGGLFILKFDRIPVLAVGIGFLIFGVAFAYVGCRLFVTGKTGRPLLGPLGFRVASYAAAFLSVFAIFGAVVSGEYFMGLSALSGMLFAYLLYKASQRPAQVMPPNNPLQPTPEVGAAERTR